MKHEARVTALAARIANKKMRDEFLTGKSDVPEQFADRLRVLKRQNLAYLQLSWSPFRPDASGGLALEILDNDALLLMDFGEVKAGGEDIGLMSVNGESMFINIAQNLSPGERIRKIAVDSMKEAMMERADEFLTGVLQDLLAGKTTYDVETRP